MIPGNLGIIFTGDTQYPLSESGGVLQNNWQYFRSAAIFLTVNNVVYVYRDNKPVNLLMQLIGCHYSEIYEVEEVEKVRPVPLLQLWTLRGATRT